MAHRLSNQIAITSSGTAVRGPDVSGGSFLLKAHPDNTDVVWVGNDGNNNVSSSNGFPINPGEAIVVRTSNLSIYWFDADVSGEKLCWLRLEA